MFASTKGLCSALAWLIILHIMKKLLSFLLLLAGGFAHADVSLPKFFSSHMVLQREAPITVYGWAAAGKTVKVSFAGQKAQAKTDAKGSWSLQLKAMPVGGPYVMTVSEANTVTFEDVYLGDVWFCSGQSNMGWKLEDATNGREELAKASHEKIKLLQVSRTMAGTPQQDIEKGTWKTCSPESALGFSAVAYFFGRELYQKYQVPIGLINASWGGTRIEDWMGEAVMGKHDAAQKTIAQMRNINFTTLMSTYDKEFKAWEAKADSLDLGNRQNWAADAYDKSGWKPLQVPTLWETACITPSDGVVWVTHTFELTAADVSGAEIKLSIGRIDNEDVTYINGKIVGQARQKDLDRVYNIPADVLKVGKNTLTMRIKNTGDIGGFRSAPDALYLQTATRKVALAGTWKHEISTKTIEEVPLRQHPNLYPTSLYNGMVAPFFGIKIKGIIWYQGESNAKNASEYAGLFQDMISGWRKQWKADYPFIFAQLPNLTNQKNLWPTVRESQQKALALPQTGMAVLIDVGTDDNIHPIHKQVVGKRMATIAGSLTYRDSGLSAPAPAFDHSVQQGSSLVVHFKNGAFAADTPKTAITGFTIAGADGVFQPADAKLQADGSIILSNPKVPAPQFVRYLWADAPGKVMLYNKDGLATGPFRSDNF